MATWLLRGGIANSSEALQRRRAAEQPMPCHGEDQEIGRRYDAMRCEVRRSGVVRNVLCTVESARELLASGFSEAKHMRQKQEAEARSRSKKQKQEAEARSKKQPPDRVQQRSKQQPSDASEKAPVDYRSGAATVHGACAWELPPQRGGHDWPLSKTKDTKEGVGAAGGYADCASLCETLRGSEGMTEVTFLGNSLFCEHSLQAQDSCIIIVWDSVLYYKQQKRLCIIRIGINSASAHQRYGIVRLPPPRKNRHQLRVPRPEEQSRFHSPPV
ncbi:hypothetical protein BZA05DRAFT_437962 [Tricharina praecox]|uniref:uncharacterized protein n=1 Tax=Tricharina praecox TaxID=43433 RepID=UPI002220EFFB|nr:uncharacterized protein BZA05DRAFT_439339 [Tricharina praecox]XP_051337430.1 uncharacterized protein BZA05DRAFT_437962 [Tricharina praecox]KAI5843206.1 hypothetical protein BZA05DRAFT_439339 [Tricharina praecox]KAI5847621.1 hypothetical protein BZA05DRAFT_437962 [Tricharina praecox]